MARLVKTMKTSSKKFLDEADIPVEEEITVNSTKNVEVDDFKPVSDDDAEEDDENDSDAPEAVSMSTSKSQIISQIKSEREARRLDREKNRQKAVKFQEQKVLQARERKIKEIATVESEEEFVTESVVNDICPLPENIFEKVLNESHQKQHQNQQVHFDSLPVSTEEILETVRQQRAKANKRRLVDSLPYAVVQVGVDGKSRISKSEIKVRRSISKMKIDRAGLNVRRIDSVIERAGRNRIASPIFYRKSSFY